MRIAIDATPAVVQLAGVGRYTRELLRALMELPGDDAYELLCSASPTQTHQLLEFLPPGNSRTVKRLPLADRWTSIAWQRLRLPLPVDAVLQPFDVFHGPDFVLPPSRRPRVVTIHDLSFRVVPQYSEPALVEYLNAAVPRSLRVADRIVAVSATVAGEIVEHFPDTRERVVAIPSGVRPPSTNVARPATREPNVLFVGTIEPRKGIDTLIAAVRLVHSQEPEAHLTIAGRIGWRSDEIMASIRQAERDGIATFFEAPDETQLHALFETAAVVAFPSRYEGFGLPLLEAMARGIPVVTSDLPVLRETCGDAAEFVPVDDAESLGTAIVRLLGDADARDLQIARGQRRVAGYSWHQTALSTRRVYAQAANRGA